MKSALMLLVATSLSASAMASQTDEAAQSLPSPPNQAAGDVPLSEPIAPVPMRSQSWAFGLSTLAGIADPFYEKVAVLGSLRHMTGNWGVELFGGRAISWAGASLDLCTTTTACSTPTSGKLAVTPGDLDYIGGASAVWRAANGKLSVGGLAPVRFGLEGHLGAGAVSYDFVSGHAETSWSPAARIGAGVEAALPRNVALRLDLEGLFYRTEIANFTELNREMLLGFTVVWQPGRGS